MNLSLVHKASELEKEFSDFLDGAVVKNVPAMPETQVHSPASTTVTRAVEQY